MDLTVSHLAPIRRLRQWWRSPQTAPAQRPSSGRDAYWAQRHATFVSDTRIPMRPAASDPAAPDYVDPRLYASAGDLVDRYVRVEHAAPQWPADPSAQMLAPLVVGALASLARARAKLIADGIEGRSYAGAVTLALCVTLIGARRLPRFYATQLATDVKVALAQHDGRHPAHHVAAEHFTRGMETQAEDQSQLAMPEAARQALLARQIETGLRSAISALVYSHIEAALWQGSFHAGGDDPSARAARVASHRVRALWAEAWGTLPEAAYLGGVLPKTLD